MKKLIILLIFINFFNISYAEKIVYINLDEVISKSLAGKSMTNQLNSLNLENRTFLENETSRLKEIETDIQNSKLILSEEKIKKKIDKLKSDVDKYNLKKNELVNNFGVIRNRNINFFFKELSKYAEKYMNDNSISIILDKKSVFMAITKDEVTEDIIKILDQNMREFKLQ